MSIDTDKVVRHRIDVEANHQEHEIREQLIRLGWTPPGRSVTADIAPNSHTLQQAVDLLKTWHRAHGALFAQTLSNPIRNAWGQEVSVSDLNEATRRTQVFLRSIGE